MHKVVKWLMRNDCTIVTAASKLYEICALEILESIPDIALSSI